MLASELIRKAHKEGIPFGLKDLFLRFDHNGRVIKCCAVGGMFASVYLNPPELDIADIGLLYDVLKERAGINLDKSIISDCPYCNKPQPYLALFISHINDRHTTDPIKIAEALEAIGE